MDTFNKYALSTHPGPGLLKELGLSRQQEKAGPCSQGTYLLVGNGTQVNTVKEICRLSLAFCWSCFLGLCSLRSADELASYFRKSGVLIFLLIPPIYELTTLHTAYPHCHLFSSCLRGCDSSSPLRPASPPVFPTECSHLPHQLSPHFALASHCHSFDPSPPYANKLSLLLS